MGLLIRLFAKMGLSQRLAGLAAWLTMAAIVLAALWGLWERGNGFRTERDLAQAQLGRQIAEYRAAYRAAMVNALTAKFAEEARQRRIKEESDNAYAEERQSADDRAAAYAAANRCVRRESDRADQGAAGGSRVSGPAGSSAVAGASADDAELVAISREDFAICTANSVALRNAHQWAIEALATH